jgi:hypothetical protein
MELCHLGDREKRRRSVRACLLDQLPVPGVAADVPSEVGHADANGPASCEEAVAVLEHVGQGEVLDDMLEEGSSGRPVRERQPAAQVPSEVGAHADQVDVHPLGQPVGARAQMQAQVGPAGSDGTGPTTSDRREQGGHVQLGRVRGEM